MKIRIFLAASLLATAGVASAEPVVIANPGVGIASISQSQLSRLFFGQTDLLPNGSKAVPLNVGGASEDEFANKLLKKTPEQVEKYWARMIFTGKAKPPREVKPEEVKAIVAKTPGAISYLDSSQVDGSVKVLTVTRE